MRKLIAGFMIVFILIVAFATYSISKVNSVGSFEYFCSLISQTHNIYLELSDIDSISYENIKSRDYASVVSARLSDKCAARLENTIRTDTSWVQAKNATDIIATYIIPSLSSFGSLFNVQKCCMRDGTYIKLIVQEDNRPFELEFSMAILNTENAELYYFIVK